MSWNLLLVFLGGGAGAVGRYLGGVAFLRLVGARQPYLATLTINVVGGVLMGLLIGALVTLGVRGVQHTDRIRLFLGVGVLGGFTTFSSFSLETVMMLERRAYATAAAYVAASVLLSALGVMLGLMIMRRTISA